ncbi:LysM peptidoglycan-binding domain-containing protein, partial [Nanoarchaeota archaeon]
AMMLTFPESFFKTEAKSPKSAQGPYQFMPDTAAGLGAIRDSMVVEVRDPIIAARLAAQYLDQLRRNFPDNNMYAAINSYNAGRGNVNRALRAAKRKGINGTTDQIVWANKHFRSGAYQYQSANYLSRVLSVRDIQSEFQDTKIAPLLEFDSIKLDYIGRRGVKPLEISERLGISIDDIKCLNPALTHKALTTTKYEDRITEGYELRLPKGYGERFKETFSDRIAPESTLVAFRSDPSWKVHIARAPLPTTDKTLADKLYDSIREKRQKGESVLLADIEKVRDQYQKELVECPQREGYFLAALGVVNQDIEDFKEEQAAKQQEPIVETTLTSRIKKADEHFVAGRYDLAYPEYRDIWDSVGYNGVTEQLDFVRENIVRILNSHVEEANEAFDQFKELTPHKLARGSITIQSSLTEEQRAQLERAKLFYDFVKSEETLLASLDSVPQSHTYDNVPLQTGSEILKYAKSAMRVVEGVETLDEKLTERTYVEERKQMEATQMAQNAVHLKYELPQGQTLWNISSELKLSLEQIMEWNSISNPDKVLAGDVLDLYVSPDTEIYVTRKIRFGDRLGTIAQAYNDSADEIAKRSGIRDPNKVKPGDEVIVRMKASQFAGSKDDVAQTVYSGSGVPSTHSYKGFVTKEGLDVRVRRGYTMNLLAERYDTTVAAIKDANNRRSTKIIAGERLTIPVKYFQYKVRPGDTVGEIAQSFDVSQRDIHLYNPGLNTRKLSIGQRVAVPYK